MAVDAGKERFYMNVKELIKKYDGKAVVDSVSFEIQKGKVTSLIGPTRTTSKPYINIRIFLTVHSTKPRQTVFGSLTSPIFRQQRA